MRVRTERGAQIVLAVLMVTLAWLAYRAWAPTAATSAGASNAVGGRPGAAGPPTAVAPDVQLEMLGRDRVQPEKASRNPFKFETRVEAAPPSPSSTPRPAVPTPSGPSAAPAVPPIALKFIGIVEPDGKAPRIAVLSDARGVVHGREGEVVLGQYRILRIGPDSIDIVHLDGRGRQTIRLNGS